MVLQDRTTHLPRPHAHRRTAAGILTVLSLCRNCRHLFERGAITLLPFRDAPGVVVAYSPWETSAYTVAVEFAGGCSSDVRVLAETKDGKLVRT